MIVELQIPDGEESKYITMRPWEIDYISHADKYRKHCVHVRTNDGEDYYPIQVNFKHNNES